MKHYIGTNDIAICFQTLKRFVPDTIATMFFSMTVDQYKKINCACLHSKNDKQERKTAIDRFKSGKEKILITSDLSSRGLDIQNISHIVQMDLPENTDFFIHRAGRTARAGKKGINVVIGDEFEMQNYSKLEKKLNITVYPKEIYKGKIIECGL